LWGNREGEVHSMSKTVFAPAREQAREPSPVVPLMILVLGLAVATMWFVVLPTLEKPPPSGRTCEVVFLTNGNTRCIEPPVPGMRAIPPNVKRSTR
jgi:hypothetical protein